jgi:hypothetical protein
MTGGGGGLVGEWARRNNFFIFLFSLRFLIGLTCSPPVHLSEIILLQHHPYMWACDVKFSVNRPKNLDSTYENLGLK